MIMTVTIVGKISLLDNVVIAYCKQDLSEYNKYIESPKCEICGRNHHRNELYIVDIDDKRVVCGKRCLENAIGKQPVSEAIHQAKEFVKNRERNPYEIEDSVVGAVYQIKNHGFASSKTGDWSSSWDFKNHYSDYVEKGSRDETYTKLADEIIQYYQMVVPTNDFERMCHTVILNGCHSDKVLGIFPALVNSYITLKQHKHNYELSKKHNLERTNYFGQIGDKIKQSIECELIDVREITRAVTYSYYDNGTSLQYIIKDNDGHIFSWITTAGIKTDMYHWLTDEHIGTKLILKTFTVKNHYESKLGHVTTIIRPKFEILNIIKRNNE